LRETKSLNPKNISNFTSPPLVKRKRGLVLDRYWLASLEALKKKS